MHLHIQLTITPFSAVRLSTHSMKGLPSVRPCPAAVTMLPSSLTCTLIVEVEKERERRLSEDQGSPEYKDRMKSYDRLIGVQEDLLRTMRKMQVRVSTTSSSNS